MKIELQKLLPNDDAKGRIWRSEIVNELAVEAEESHGWAISYSDLLMVLMSFFVLFFSFEEKKPEEIIDEIALSIRKDQIGTDETKQSGSEGGGAGGVDSASKAAPVETSPTAKTENSMADDLGARLQKIVDDSQELVKLEKRATGFDVVFKDNLFSPGEYGLGREEQKRVLRLLDVLVPYQDRIDVFFVGHADSQPLARSKSEIISNNFVLSSLRATSALTLALQHGFSSERIFAQAHADNTEQLRTISLRIQLARRKVAH